MNKTCLAVGIDVGKDELVVATGEKRPRSFGTTPGEIRRLYRWLQKQANGMVLHVGMEATGVYSTTVALGLKTCGDMGISVINPAQIKAHSRALLRRTKTDAVDAQVIRDFVCKHHPPLWTPPTAAQRRLAALVAQADAFTAEKQRWLNRQQTQRHAADTPREVTRSTTLILKTLQRQLDNIEIHMKALCNNDPGLAEIIALVSTIKGVKFRSAVRILSHGGDDLTQRTRRQLDAHAGLAPAHRQSGTSVRGKSHLAKQGNAKLRRALYMPTLVAVHHNPIFRQHYQKLLKRGKLKKVALVACMRKLLNLIRAMLINRKPFNPQYQLLT